MTIATAIQIHPLALRVPGMTEAEFAALRDDIAANGLAQAITMFEGKVLDGRHRLRACDETGTVPRFEEYEGDSPATFVLSLNGKRRHLTAGQLAMLATDFLPDLESEAKARQGSRTDLSTFSPNGEEVQRGSLASERAADLVGVSARSVQRAKRVQDADPDLAEQVRQGTVTINAANDQVAERQQMEPTRDGSHKRSAEELVTRILSKLAPTVAALEHFDWTPAMTSESPLAEWDKQLTDDIIVPLSRLRSDIRKVLSDG